MGVKLTGEEKAAILLLSIDKNMAAAIFKNLGEQDIQKLTYFISNQKNIPPSVRTEVLNEFYELCLAQGYVTGGGAGYAKEVLTEALGTQKCMEIMGKISNINRNKPFKFLRDVSPIEVSSMLRFERNQTIALVLSYMDSEQAAMVLSNLDEGRQLDIVRRIAQITKISPEVIKKVEEKVKSKLSGSFETTTSNDESVGINTVASILSSVDRKTEVKIFEQLEKEDLKMAEEIKKQMFVFEDIAKLDVKTIQNIISKLPNKELALAMKSTTEKVKKLVFSNMSTRAKDIVMQEIDMLGQVRLSEVLEAQQKIVAIILEMEKTGEIIITKGEADKLVG